MDDLVIGKPGGRLAQTEGPWCWTASPSRLQKGCTTSAWTNSSRGSARSRGPASQGLRERLARCAGSTQSRLSLDQRALLLAAAFQVLEQQSRLAH
jgi:hypothetical protein